MERKGNSKTGRASLILSIIGIFLYALYYLLYFILTKIDPYFDTDYYSDGGYFLGIIIVFIWTLVFLVSLTSFGLGVAGIFQKTRVRKPAFIGTSISSAILSGYLISIIVYISQNIS